MAVWDVFDRWLESYRWWWCALSGLLLIASFAPFASATCGWIALIPAWCVLARSERVQRHPMRYGYLIGLIYFGGVFWWISNVTVVGIFFLVLYLALYPALWFLFVARLVLPKPGQSTPPILVQALATAALWVVLEWWRSWFLTGFNWNELGISQAPSIVFRQLAAYGGVHLISFVLVAVNILWAEGLLALAKAGDSREPRPALRLFDSLALASFGTSSFALALLIVVLTFALGAHRLLRHHGETPSGPLVRYACIQPNVPQIVDDGTSNIPYRDREASALQAMQNLSAQAINTAPKFDLLIWPEAIISPGVFDPPLNDAVRDICETYNGYFLLGSEDFDVGGGRKLYNSAYLFTPGGESFHEYRKTRLVILGEFLPFGDTFPWLRKATGIGIDFTPGPGPVKFVMTKPAVSFAPLICFEDTLPEVADKAVLLDPDFFVTITNDGWYQGWCAAWGIRQHLNHAIFRSIEHDRPMVRCANTGISCLIDSNGTVLAPPVDAAVSGIDVGGIFRGTVHLFPVQPTLYERWGDWIILISSVVIVMLGIRHLVARFVP